MVASEICNLCSSTQPLQNSRPHVLSQLRHSFKATTCSTSKVLPEKPFKDYQDLTSPPSHGCTLHLHQLMLKTCAAFVWHNWMMLLRLKWLRACGNWYVICSCYQALFWYSPQFVRPLVKVHFKLCSVPAWSVRTYVCITGVSVKPIEI